MSKDELPKRKKAKWYNVLPSAKSNRRRRFLDKLSAMMNEVIDESDGEFSARNIIEDLMKMYLPDFQIVEKRKASAEAIISLQTECSLSERKKSSMLRWLKDECEVNLPTVREIADYKKSRYCTVNETRAEDGFTGPGVFTTYKDSIVSTVEQLHAIGIIPPAPEDCNSQILLTIKDGMDGAGGQLKIKGNEIAGSTMELMGYVLLHVDDISHPDEEPKRIWTNNSPNSHFSLKPLALILEKESKDLATALYKLYPTKIAPILVNIGSRMILVHISIKRSMVDGKVIRIISGRTGAYCVFCDHTASAHYEKANAYFDNLGSDIVYSSLESLQQLFSKHAKHNMDAPSKERYGFKHKPIGDVEQTTVLHSIINTCRWLLKCIAISNSTLDTNLLNKGAVLTDEQNGIWEKEKFILCQKILENHKIRLMEIGRGHTGGGLTGGEAKLFFQRIDELTYLFKNKSHRPILTLLIKRLRAVLNVLNSNRHVEVEAFRIYCRLTTDIIVQKLSWMRITPTLHMLLSHSWQWIEQNDSMGLVKWSEEALEAKHGHARNIRKFRCFQGDLVANLKQCHQQLQLQSDLVLNKKFAFRSKENVHTHNDNHSRSFILQ